jgi:serine protease AprX
MLYAPASDPFVITVGGLDTVGTPDPADDVNAPWSGHGYTAEGFAKPELAAPGRFMVGPISAGSLLKQSFPERVVAPGYMWMSGTSFAAPVVAGAAARIIARHPDWTPDQVKGALMLRARPLAGAVPMSAGVGEIDVAAAASETSPPNPNAALNQFVVHDWRVPGGRVFDTEAWSVAAWSSAAWSSAAWSSAAWSSAAWSSAAWSSAAWANAAWSSAAWADAAWASSGWGDAAWSSAAWADAAWSHASSAE